MNGISFYLTIGKRKGWQIEKDGPSIRIKMGRISVCGALTDIEDLMHFLLSKAKDNRNEIKDNRKLNEIMESSEERDGIILDLKKNIEEKDVIILDLKKNIEEIKNKPQESHEEKDKTILNLKKEIKEIKDELESFIDERNDLSDENDVLNDEIKEMKEELNKKNKNYVQLEFHFTYPIPFHPELF